MAKLDFDYNPEDAQKEFYVKKEVLPPGWHKIVLIKSDLVPASTGKGDNLKLEFEGPNGKILKRSLCIIHSNERTQIIGRAEWSKIVCASGYKGVPKETTLIHGRPMEAKVEIEGIESNTEVGKMIPVNKIVDYRPIGSAQATTPVSEGKAKVGW